MLVFIEVVLDRTTHDAMNAFKGRGAGARRDPGVPPRGRRLDYLIKTRVANMQAYRELVGSVIWALPGVRKTHLCTVMERCTGLRRDAHRHAAEPKRKNTALAASTDLRWCARREIGHAIPLPSLVLLQPRPAPPVWGPPTEVSGARRA